LEVYASFLSLFKGAKLSVFENLTVYWPFTVVGVFVFIYAMYLIHSGVDIGVGHSILVVAGFLIALAPFVTVKVGTDGSVELQRLEVINVATQSTVEGVGELQKRLENLALETEKRLSALEDPQASGPFSHTGIMPLPSIANPPNTQFPVLDDPKGILETLQRKEWRNRMPIY
jgi:hypothetical protein